jgi:phenylacetate-coenzyme A ligase PaaK-like adenylate-forming protein
LNNQWNHKIFKLKGEVFEKLALEIFRFQYENNPVYRAFADTLHKNTLVVKKFNNIPFFPIAFFKTHEVKTTTFEAETVFESSGTTGMEKSRHFVKDLSLYEESFLKGFEFFYGPVKNYCILALLPSYLERKNSSLVYMAQKLIHESGHPQSGFYLNEYEKLCTVLAVQEKRNEKTLLLGVTFVLLDFAESCNMELNNTIVMETGGMKGRRKELLRSEVHEILKSAFHSKTVHSEYGMTELLSQAYSSGNGIFRCPPWMKVLVRDEDDPLLVKNSGRGAINIIDLANLYSCSFIATDDAGIVYEDGSFEIIGRLDNSDLRGCSLLTI